MPLQSGHPDARHGSSHKKPAAWGAGKTGGALGEVEVARSQGEALGLTLQGRHHSLPQGQHQAQWGAEQEEAGDLEVQAGSAGGAVGHFSTSWAGDCAGPPGLPGGRGGLQAVGQGGEWGAQASCVPCPAGPPAWEQGRGKVHLFGAPSGSVVGVVRWTVRVEGSRLARPTPSPSAAPSASGSRVGPTSGDSSSLLCVGQGI